MYLGKTESQTDRTTPFESGPFRSFHSDIIDRCDHWKRFARPNAVWPPSNKCHPYITQQFFEKGHKIPVIYVKCRRLYVETRYDIRVTFGYSEVIRQTHFLRLQWLLNPLEAHAETNYEVFRLRVVSSHPSLMWKLFKHKDSGFKTKVVILHIYYTTSIFTMPISWNEIPYTL